VADDLKPGHVDPRVIDDIARRVDEQAPGMR
jgi:hypothetical protein